MRPCCRGLPPSVAVGLVWACCLAGCQQAPARLAPAGSVLAASQEPAPPPTDRQVADVQVALGRVQERHGELGLAQPPTWRP